MIPVGDDNRSRRTVPVVTYGLIVFNVIFFLIELSSGDAFIERWAFVPSRFLADPIGDFPTLFTAMFMHAGWVHLLGNMLYLWIFGDNVEDRFGQGNYLIFYLLCGIGATFTQLMFSADSSIPNLGASGAVAGVLGAYILMFPQARVSVLMGRALAAIINVLDPEVIVLGGGMSNIERLYDDVPRAWEPFVFSDHIATRLCRPVHGDASGVRGAAWLWNEADAAPR